MMVFTSCHGFDKNIITTIKVTQCTESLPASLLPQPPSSLFKDGKKRRLCSKEIFLRGVPPCARAPGNLKVLANKDTMLRIHCWGHKCFPFACTSIICCGYKICIQETKIVSDFCQKHFVSTKNVSPFT